MKKLLAAALAVLFLAGCATSREMVISPADETRQIALKSGEILVVRLPANHTTGYAWKKVDRKTGMELFEQDGVVNYVQYQHPDHIVGSPGTEVWRLRAIAPGQQTLRFIYRPAWESLTVAEKMVNFDIVVH